MHFVRHTLHEFVYARYVLMNVSLEKCKNENFFAKEKLLLEITRGIRTDTLYIYHNFSELNFGTKIARFG